MNFVQSSEREDSFRRADNSIAIMSQKFRTQMAFSSRKMRQSSSSPHLEKVSELEPALMSSPKSSPRLSLDMLATSLPTAAEPRSAPLQVPSVGAPPEAQSRPSGLPITRNEQRPRSASKARYLNLVAERGADLFRRCTSSEEVGTPPLSATGSVDSSCGPNSRRLVSTPSMVMLSEAAALLKESPSALEPLDAESTGGVYQLKRQTSYYGAPDDFATAQALRGIGHSQLLRKTGLGRSGDNSLTRSSGVGLGFGRERSRSLTSSHLERGAEAAQQQTTEKHQKGSSSSNIDVSPLLTQPQDNILDSQHARLALSRAASTKGRKLGLVHSASSGSIRRLPTSPMSAASVDRVVKNISLVDKRGNLVDRGMKKRHPSKVAVFKPEDEETGAKTTHAVGVRNPERAGMIVGGGARRERAAYILDKNISRFSGVPETALVYSKMPEFPQSGSVKVDKAKIEDLDLGDGASIVESESKGNAKLPSYKLKRGSLQRFCESDGSAEDRNDLVRKAHPREVHGIGILDLRIFNTDRHSGNVLCKDNGVSVTLIPIDHGLSLPDWHFLAEAYFDWQWWAQADVAFDEDTLEAIRRIDTKKDANDLRDLGFPEGCVATNLIGTLALKIGAANGLTLKDLGTMFQRPFCPGHNLHNKFFSPLEHFVLQACEMIGDTYHPAGTESAESATLQVVEEDCKEEEAEEVQIEQVERNAFGNRPPRSEFYDAFVEVLETQCCDDKWRQFVKI